jgi:hypothetical protein
MKSNNLVDYTELVDEVKFENGQIDDNAFSNCGVLSKRGFSPVLSKRGFSANFLYENILNILLMNKISQYVIRNADHEINSLK